MRERAFGSLHPDIASTYDSLAGLYIAQGRHSQAEQFIAKTLELRSRLLPPDHPDLAVSRVRQAQVLHAGGRDREAERLLSAALSRLEAAFGPDHPSVGFAVETIAQLYRDRKDQDKARRWEARARSIRERSAAKPNPAKN